MNAELRVMAFDLDDTLTASKSKIDQQMADLLGDLLARLDVCIISGGRFEQIEAQVLQYLHAPAGRLAHLHIMPTCGTRYYIWRNSAWHRRYAEDLTEDEKSRIISVLAEGAKHLGFWEQNPWGEIIEDRGSQITYSALGQRAPADAKHEWDRDGSKKRKLRDYAAERLPDLEVQVGGTTSVDVTRKGIDKAYGIKRLIEQLNISPDQLLFIGDRLREGGNDYPVRALGVRWLEVTQWQDTARYVQDLVTKAQLPERDRGASPPTLGPGISTGANAASQPDDGAMTAPAEPSAQFIVDEVSPSYWKVTFENGPVNLIDADSIEQLARLVTRIEESPAVTVVVFDSANPEYFMAHWDLKANRARVAAMAPGPTGLHPYLDNLVRLSKVPAVTISAIRGRARGAGSEFVLATDIRFAGDKAILGHFEVGLGSVPGGGPMARLSRLVGRGRAAEILLGADDIPAELAERYGYVNRVLPDAGLDGFVDAFARRIAGFDKAAVAGTKALLDWASLPPDEEFGPGLAAFFRTSGRAENAARVRYLFENGLQTPAGVELDLGRAVGEFASSLEPWLG